MGRHTVPGSGKPTPDQGFWVRLAAAGVALLLVAGYLLARGEDATTSTAPRDSRSATPTTPTTAASPSPTASTPSSPAVAESASAAPAGPPPTLSFVVRRAAFITVRVPGGRTLVSRLFRKGQRRSFDQKVLQVVNGRPSAVVFTVNGTRREPGPADEPETFTVRRR